MAKRFSPLGGNTAYVLSKVAGTYKAGYHDCESFDKIKACERATIQGNIRVRNEARKKPKVERRRTPIGARGLIVIGDIFEPIVKPKRHIVAPVKPEPIVTNRKQPVERSDGYQLRMSYVDRSTGLMMYGSPLNDRHLPKTIM